jgi:hypothetical protein
MRDPLILRPLPGLCGGLYGCLALFPLPLFLLWWRAHVDTAGTLPAINRFFGSTRDRRLTHPITVIRVGSTLAGSPSNLT